ncbi:MAG: NAD-dependent epimerase/dehydratase family protein [Chloroflexi bacterium]|nr:NAD-dependent epimerase/dehydratase family protein [Chloroflexota bacterium]
MKIGITGATGFVGGALARALVAEGHEIVALTRLLKRPSSPKTGRRKTRINADLIEWRQGNIIDPASLRGVFDGVDWLIHAAGMLGEAGVPESAYFHLHEQGTENVLTEAKRSGCSRVLYVSSPGVLGPISGPPATETAVPAPSNPYERSKAAAERMALRYAESGLPVIIARPEFIYGPGDWHVLGLFKAVGDGRFFYIGSGSYSCHPTYIEDAVAGMLLALRDGRSGEIYHITGPNPVSFRQLAETIAAAQGASPPRVTIPKSVAWLGAAALEMAGELFGKRPPLSRTGVAFFSENRAFSWQKAHKELGYTPQFDLNRGIQATVAWYRENGAL